LRLLRGGVGWLLRQKLGRDGRREKTDPEGENWDSRHAGILNEADRNSKFQNKASSASIVVESGMANLTLVYGMRLLPSEDIAEVGDAPVKLTNGREARVTMHVLEGSKEDIEKQLRTSLEAFFDLYPEI
jgi:hypothetical protein